ncbi:hypothetical protein DPMN_019183 [Dreissena polymorpha]|uniref:Uncharacterized protein n=1 Tax=Dreissena polymorpha TaxID=45954 RepID=A0A9D4NEJ9_DREPO|nr:hypothetical protein DPMN_019183 [Dreissena polymorpha]
MYAKSIRASQEGDVHDETENPDCNMQSLLQKHLKTQHMNPLQSSSSDYIISMVQDPQSVNTGNLRRQ